jgi:hypothetical protein
MALQLGYGCIALSARCVKHAVIGVNMNLFDGWHEFISMLQRRKVSMMSEHRGRCLCGLTRFTARGKPNWAGHCHCNSCRRNTASPFTSYFGVSHANYAWTGEKPASFTSSPGVTRYFCAECGTPMAYYSDRWDHETHFYIASLDDPAAIEPQFHVFWREKLPWINIVDDLPKYPGTVGEGGATDGSVSNE